MLVLFQMGTTLEKQSSALKPFADIPGAVAMQNTTFLHILRTVIASDSSALQERESSATCNLLKRAVILHTKVPHSDKCVPTPPITDKHTPTAGVMIAIADH